MSYAGTVRRIVKESDNSFWLLIPVYYSGSEHRYHRVLPDYLVKFKHYTIQTITEAANDDQDLDQYDLPSDSSMFFASIKSKIRKPEFQLSQMRIPKNASRVSVFRKPEFLFSAKLFYRFPQKNWKSDIGYFAGLPPDFTVSPGPRHPGHIH